MRQFPGDTWQYLSCRQRIKGRFIKKVSEEGTRPPPIDVPAAEMHDPTHQQLLQPETANAAASAAGPSNVELVAQP